MNSEGTITTGTETFTYLPDAKAVQKEAMVVGEVKIVTLPAVLSGDELAFNGLDSSPIFYKLNLKSLTLNIKKSTYDAVDGNLALTGTGQCSLQ
jgi:hypothetical protein